MNCPHCGAAIAPNSRFCTECGKPLAAAGPAPMPPAPQPGRPPVPGQPMPGAPMGMPPVPPPTGGAPMMPPTGAMPMPPRPGTSPMMPPTGGVMPPAPTGGMPMAPAPVAPAPVAPAPVAPAPVAPAPVAPATQVAAATLAATDAYKLATTGDLLNNGQPVAVLVTESQLTVQVPGAAPLIEAIPGLRHVVVGDFDGDGLQELAVFNDTQVWVLRFSAHSSVPSGKVTLKEMPEHLTRAPFTYDGGRTVLMSATTEQISFYVIHPSKGLVEIAKTPVPFIEP